MTEIELFIAYAQTTFVADLPQGSVALRVNGVHPSLDQWLGQNGWTTWGFVAAWNPASIRLTLEENQRRHHAQQLEERENGSPIHHERDFYRRTIAMFDDAA